MGCYPTGFNGNQPWQHAGRINTTQSRNRGGRRMGEFKMNGCELKADAPRVVGEVMVGCDGGWLRAGLNRNDAVQPRMDTDRHGCRPGERPLGRTLVGALVGGRIFTESCFQSVFIRVHPWLKPFSTAWIRLKLTHGTRVTFKSSKQIGVPENGLPNTDA